MREVGFTHRFEVVSRSGRAAATLGVVDLDDDPRHLERIARDMATTAYSPLNAPQAHAELSEALLAATVACEGAPGQTGEGRHALPDGRTARVTRVVGGV